MSQPDAGPPMAADAPLPDIPRIVKALAGWADYAARGVGTNPVPYVEELPRMIRETLAAVESLARELATARAEIADHAKWAEEFARTHPAEWRAAVAREDAAALAEALREAVEKCVSLFNGAYRVGDAENLSAVKNGRAVLARHARGSP